VNTTKAIGKPIPRTRAFSLAHRRWLLAYALIAPALLWRFATALYPLGYTAYLSFFDRSPLRRSFDFVGLENYQRLLGDEAVHQTLEFTAIFTIASVGLQVCYGLAIALLLNQSFAGRGLVRAANLLPWAMPIFVAGLAAVWIFDTDFGMVNDIIWRLTGARPVWLASVEGARAAVIMVDVWKNTPFLALVFLGGLQGIARELYEAARIDGASNWSAFLAITVPLLMPLIITMAMFAAISRVISFDLVYALTHGGPGTATSLLPYRVYVEAFRALDFGYASALAVLNLLVVVAVAIVAFAWLKYSWSRS